MQFIKAALTKLTKVLKNANRRIAAIQSKFGKESQVAKSITGPLQSGDLQKYFRQTKSGGYRFQVKTIINDLKNDPTGENQQILERLINQVGLKYGGKSGLIKTKEGNQIPTVTELKKKWQTTLDPEHKLSEQEYLDLINKAEEMEEDSDYNSAYYDLKNIAGKAKADDIYQDILGRKADGNLSDKDKMNLKIGLVAQLSIIQSKEEKKEKSEKAKQFGKVKQFGKKG